MKVRTSVEFSEEVEVDISFEDVFAALASLPEDESMGLTLSAINSAYAALRRVPDSVIARMTPAQLRSVSNALKTQADRYLPAEELLAGDAPE